MAVTNESSIRLPLFPPFADLRNRSVPPAPSKAEKKEISRHGKDFQSISKLLCPSQGPFKLIDSLSNIFYPGRSIGNFRKLSSCISKNLPVLDVLKKCYSFLTHCSGDVDLITNPQHLCEIFQNKCWMATYAVHLAGSLQFAYPSDDALMAFRFPNLKTECYQHFAALTLYWEAEKEEDDPPASYTKESQDRVLALLTDRRVNDDEVKLVKDKLGSQGLEVRSVLVNAVRMQLVEEQFTVPNAEMVALAERARSHIPTPPKPKMLRKKKSKESPIASRRSTRLKARNDNNVASDSILAKELSLSFSGKNIYFFLNLI